MLNDYFQKQFDSDNCALLPKNVADDVLSDFKTMSNLGINNSDDQNRFFMLRNHVPEIVKLIFNTDLNDNTARAITAEVFRNRENKPVDTLLGLIEAIDLALKKMIPKNIRPKIAYPQPGPKNQLQEYDIGRWVSATREIYKRMSSMGNSFKKARESVIGDWDRREKMDYENWLRFYKERVPEKYPKLAQDEGIFSGGLPISSLRARPPMGKIPNPVQSGQGHATKVPPGLPQHLPHSDESDVRDRIEVQRGRLVSRLNAAEKLLCSLDGQLFAGDDQDFMLKLLQDLKRKIQTANKRTVNSTLFHDYIYRTAYQLKDGGNKKAAGFFLKLAQLDMGNLPPLPPLGDQPPAPPGAQSGQVSSSGPPNKEETHAALKEFFHNLEHGANTPIPETETPTASIPKTPEPVKKPTNVPGTPLNNENPIGIEESKESEAFLSSDYFNIKLGSGVWNPAKIAQNLPPRPNRPLPQEQDRSVSVEEDQSIQEDHTDDVIEAALKNVSVNDIVNRLEMLVSIYNQREISRQLSILDIMMARKGLAAYFPAMGEAMNKALEANQYIGHRLEDILTKVKGSISAPGAEKWIDVTPENHPETAGLRKNLDDQKALEEQRKEQRRQKEIAKMQGGESPPDVGPVAEGRVPEQEGAELRPSTVEKAPRLEVR